MSQPSVEGAKPQTENIDPSPQAATPPTPTTPAAEKADEKPGTDWEKHAKTWEERARTNKQQLDQMHQQWGKLASIFAPDGGEQADKPEDMIKALTDRIDRSERQAEIERLARKHGITEDGDIAILASVTDAAQREALAARLKSQTQVIPPDPGQGVQPSASAEDAEYANYYPSRK